MGTKITLDPKTFRLELLRAAASIMSACNLNTEESIEEAKTIMSSCGLLEEEIKPLQSEISPSNQQDHYLVHLTYTHVPSMTELEKEYGKGQVSELFDGREWQEHASCKGLDKIPDEKEFLVRSFAREISSEEVIKQAGKYGYRPATHQEAVEFARACPDAYRSYRIVAIGSFAIYLGGKSVAVLAASQNNRFILSDWFECDWPEGIRFLLVSK